jgi:hypothetical protein
MSANTVAKFRAHQLRTARKHHEAGRLELARDLYCRILDAEPKHAEALHYAALLGAQLGRIARANGETPRDEVDQHVAELMAAACEANPQNAGAVHNFARFAHDCGDLVGARALYQRALDLDQSDGASWIGLGNVFGEIGNRLRAEAAWSRALECPPRSADERFARSFVELSKGDYLNGFANYEARLECHEFMAGAGRSTSNAPRWTGQRLDRSDGALLVYGEQGAGDAIMMSRYLPLVADRVHTIYVELMAGLVPLFASAFPMERFIARGEALPAHVAKVSLMSLPAIFETPLDDIPPAIDFAIPRWEYPEPNRVGLCWHGSRDHAKDRPRSIPFEKLFPLFDVPGIEWQSLQLGEGVDGLVAPLELGDFLATAREIVRCDRVITVDTSIAHLAASMGVETWILLPFVAEWRWMLDRDDSPWYPSATLIRQAKAGDWDGVIHRVAKSLDLMIGQ